ncbi:5-formyltetrahydrofolate cyclo-ligase [Chelativorans sp.]|uniref:5-formyltetrahydrofolate cyclo-ligase n=1 Tax=Chelativorans sp. TaxID=2203393 RepID=UPI002810C0B8|nr:5-formyltetrahydrofolate cyclo-ligase [Chelativorans sp.]
MTSDEDKRPAGYASPPCFMHEVDPAPDATDPQQRLDVMRWRKAERERLIQARLETPAGRRRMYGERIAAYLEEIIGEVAGATVSAYWPFRGEPDLRPLLERISRKGGRTALPVVVQRGAPLVFRAWTQGDALEKGIWNIPVPPPSALEVTPNVVIAPVVGFDPACYRLGYGGGFFDRTLAVLPKRPRVVGVGYSVAAIPTIYPQRHDIALDVVVTEEGVHLPSEVSI